MTTATDLSLLQQTPPRYTSYPPFPAWGAADPQAYQKILRGILEKKIPLSIYVHIPFCSKRCLFCGCFVIASRNPTIHETYISLLKKEISLISRLGTTDCVQLHFGGGTPTSVDFSLLQSVVEHLKNSFPWHQKIEVAIEVDPRTIDSKEQLKNLYQIGFNRISFGVQDLDPKVQKAIGRIHSKDKIEQVCSWALEIPFQEINIDLVYGLPYQTMPSFEETIESIINIGPHRIALFCFAHVPLLRTNQKALDHSACPSLLEKHQIFLKSRERLIKAGYIPIGLDHFVKPNISLSIAFKEKTMTRNFQGYDLGLSSALVGIGLSSISQFPNSFFQNVKDLSSYSRFLEDEIFPVSQGKILSQNDLIRGWTIQNIMCGYGIDKIEFFQKFGLCFDVYFSKELDLLKNKISSDFYINTENQFLLTELGTPFLRHICYIFDEYRKSV